MAGISRYVLSKLSGVSALKKFAMIASLAVSFAMATTAQAATQFVTNGDFSSLTAGLGQLGYNTDATGWSTSGYNFVMNVGDVGSDGQYGNLSLWDVANGGSNTWNGLGPTDSGNYVAMDGDFSVGPITQTITGLTPGSTYTLSFAYAFGQQYTFNGGTSQGLIVDLGSTQVLSTLENPIDDHSFSGWQTFTGTVKATSASEVLSFLAQSTPAIPPFTLVTDVSLIGSVPEPASWGMMIVGLGAMGAVARRRRRMLAAA
jgi:hypothetical protein